MEKLPTIGKENLFDGLNCSPILPSGSDLCKNRTEKLVYSPLSERNFVLQDNRLRSPEAHRVSKVSKTIHGRIIYTDLLRFDIEKFCPNLKLFVHFHTGHIRCNRAIMGAALAKFYSSFISFMVRFHSFLCFFACGCSCGRYFYSSCSVR